MRLDASAAALVLSLAPCLAEATVQRTAVHAIAFSADGRLLATGAEDRRIKVWNLDGESPPRELAGHGGSVGALAFHPGRPWLASGGMDDTIRIWDVVSGTTVATLRGHERWITALAFDPGGGPLASASADRTVRLWDPATGRELGRMRRAEDWALCLAFSPDGRRLAAGAADHRVRIWDRASGVLERSLDGHARWVTSVAFSPDGRRIYSASLDGTVREWDAVSGAALRTVHSGSGWMTSVAVSADGRFVAAGAFSGTVRVWNADSMTLATDRIEAVPWITQIAFSPDSRRLGVASRYEGLVKVWETATWKREAQLRSMAGGTRLVNTLAVSGDGGKLAGSQDGGEVAVWDWRRRRLLHRHRPYHESADGVAWSRRADRLIVIGHGRAARWIDLKDGAVVRELPEVGGDLVAMAPASGLMAAPAADGSVGLRAWEDGSYVGRLERASGEDLLGLSFAPGGSRLASWDKVGNISVWNIPDGTRRDFPSPAGGVGRVAFLGRREEVVAVAAGDIRLLEAGSGATLSILEPARVLSQDYAGLNPVSLVAVKDGRFVAAAWADGNVSLWDVQDPRGPVKLAERVLTGGAPENEVDRLTSLAWISGETVAAGLVQGRIRLWDYKREDVWLLDPALSRRP